MNNMFEYIKEGLVFGILFVAIRILASFLYAAVIMWLWNLIIPNIVNVAELSYWQAFGLLWICLILFKSTTVQWK